MIHTQDADFTLYQGDSRECLAEIPDQCVHAVVTSPPYLDARPEYGTIEDWRVVFAELARVVTGPMLWNVGRLWRAGVERLWWIDLIYVATAVGWEHWDTLIWVKPNGNPILGRVATNSHEYVLVFGRPGVEVNEDARRVPYAEGSVERLGRRWISSISVKGDTSERNGQRRAERKGERESNPKGARAPSWFVASTGKEKGNPHPAPMPLDVASELVTLASWPGQTVLDPFAGSGTTALAARKLDRYSVAIEVDADFCNLIARRLQQQSLFTEAT